MRYSKKLLNIPTILTLAMLVVACGDGVTMEEDSWPAVILDDDRSIEEDPLEWTDTMAEELAEMDMLATRAPNDEEDDADDKPNPVRVVQGQERPDLRAEVTPKRENAVGGAVSGLFYWPLYAVHAAVLPDGDVITYGAIEQFDDNGNPIKSVKSNGLSYSIWSRGLGGTKIAHQVLDVETQTNIFCAAQTLMPTGELLITGGDQNLSQGGTSLDGIADVNTFTKSAKMEKAGSMNQARWYPSVVQMPSGEVLVHGGRSAKALGDGGKENDLVAYEPEVYSPVTRSFRSLTGIDGSKVYQARRRGWYYPRSWLDKQGTVTFTSPNSRKVFQIDINGNDGTGSVKLLGKSEYGQFKHFFPSVMYDKHKILSLRSSKKVTSMTFHEDGSFTETLLAKLRRKRVWSDATVLADGTVAVNGGATKRQKLDFAVKYIDLYDPVTNTWTQGADATAARLYHSSSVLLPDATVLMAGGGPPGPINQLNAEIFYPPYLFDSEGNWATRPVVSGFAANYQYGDVVELDVTANNSESGTNAISKVALVRLGSTTHSSDMGQRYWPIDDYTIDDIPAVDGVTSSTLRFNIPENPIDNPTGFFMVFVMNADGVPSEGQVFKIWQP